MIPFILGALAAVGLSELSKNKPKMADGGSVDSEFVKDKSRLLEILEMKGMSTLEHEPEITAIKNKYKGYRQDYDIKDPRTKAGMDMLGFLRDKNLYAKGGGVDGIQISVNAQRYLEMLEEMYPKFLNIDTTTPSKDINKAISELEEKGLIKRLSYSRGFAEYGLKDKKYAKGGGVGSSFYALTSDGMGNKKKQKINSVSYWKNRLSNNHTPTLQNIQEFLGQVPFDENISIYTYSDEKNYGQLHSAYTPLYIYGAKSVDAIIDENDNIIWNKYKGSKYVVNPSDYMTENHKYATGGALSDAGKMIKEQVKDTKDLSEKYSSKEKRKDLLKFKKSALKEYGKDIGGLYVKNIKRKAKFLADHPEILVGKVF